MGWVKLRSQEQPATTSGRSYPYKGLFLCKTCKFNVTAYTKIKKLAGGTEAEYVFYTCTKKSKKIECDEKQVSDHALEQDIEARMREYEITEAAGVECSNWLNRHYNAYIKKHNQDRPQWLKDRRNAQKSTGCARRKTGKRCDY